MLAAAQLNRGNENHSDKRPQLRNLKESGALEQDADVVILLYWDDYYKRERSQEPNVAEVDLAKNRHGPTGMVKMFWDGPLMQFRGLEEAYPLGRGEGEVEIMRKSAFVSVRRRPLWGD